MGGIDIFKGFHSRISQQISAPMVPTWRTLLKDKSNCCNCSLAQHVSHFYGVCSPQMAFLIGKNMMSSGWSWVYPRQSHLREIYGKLWTFPALKLENPSPSCGDLEPKNQGINRNGLHHVASRCIPQFFKTWTSSWFYHFIHNGQIVDFIPDFKFVMNGVSFSSHQSHSPPDVSSNKLGPHLFRAPAKRGPLTKNTAQQLNDK